MNISANVLVCLRPSEWLSALGLFSLMTLGVFRLARCCGCQFVGDVACVWGMWGGLVCCPWDSQGDGGAVSVSFSFCFGFWSGVGCDFGRCGMGGHLGWCSVWGELQAFKFGSMVKNRTPINKNLTVT